MESDCSRTEEEDACFCTSCAGITRSPDITICEDCAKEARGETVEPM